MLLLPAALRVSREKRYDEEGTWKEALRRVGIREAPTAAPEPARIRGVCTGASDEDPAAEEMAAERIRSIRIRGNSTRCVSAKVSTSCSCVARDKGRQATRKHRREKG